MYVGSCLQLDAEDPFDRLDRLDRGCSEKRVRIALPVSFDDVF